MAATSMSHQLLYRGLDQATLDREYNARASVPSFDEEYARYVVESERVKREIPHIPNIVYDQASGEALDLYPAEPGSPVFLWVHGGYCRATSKDDNAFVAAGLKAHGMAVAVMNYTLAPAVGLDEIVRQVRSAVAFLHRARPTFGLGEMPITVGGSSAGGHLVGMLLAADWQDAFEIPADVIGPALALSGLHDIDPLRHTQVNEWLNLDAGTIARNSPIRLIPEVSQAHLIASVGGLETSEFKRQTTDYVAAWRAAGHPVTNVDMMHHNHFDIALSLKDPDSPLTRAVTDVAACFR